ncbi:protease modulator HflC, partial [Salmonella enterica subsp. enterica serovar Anatum]|nr:protease modulator HflC [Salmonella enterica subsp. enterica serovar Anatum]
DIVTDSRGRLTLEVRDALNSGSAGTDDEVATPAADDAIAEAAALVVLKGNITVNGTTPVNEAQLVVLSQQGKTLHLEASSDASV